MPNLLCLIFINVAKILRVISRLNGMYTNTTKMAFFIEEKIKCAVIFEQTKSALTVRIFLQ